MRTNTELRRNVDFRRVAETSERAWMRRASQAEYAGSIPVIGSESPPTLL